MSDAPSATRPDDPRQETPRSDPSEALRLRAPPPRVVRLSRKVLIGLGATSAATVFVAVLFALHLRTPRAPATNLIDSARPNPAESVKNAPADYATLRPDATAAEGGVTAATGANAAAGLAAGVPKLGPPLPGDLGRPILNANAQVSVPPIGVAMPPGMPASEPAGANPGSLQASGNGGIVGLKVNQGKS